MTTKKTPASLNTLQVASGVASLAAVGQTILGFMLSTGNFSVATMHASIGGIALLSIIVAGVASVLWKKASGNTGLMGHGVGMAVLGLAQFALGEVGGGLATVHIILGVAFLVGAVALAVLSIRKPGVAAA